jgi:hypothetical protein
VTMKVRRYFHAVLVTVAAASTIGTAQPVDLPSQGGSGGVPFRFECAAGEYLIGLGGRGVSWMDSIYPFCAEQVPGEMTLIGMRPGDVFGGSGGRSIAPRLCHSKGSAVVEMRLGTPRRENSLIIRDDPEFVTDLYFRCATLEPPHARTGIEEQVLSGDHWIRGVKGRAVIRRPPTACPPGQLAVGIHGRAGEYVDSLGLICGPAPKAVAAADVAARAGRIPLPERQVSEATRTGGIQLPERQATEATRIGPAVPAKPAEKVSGAPAAGAAAAGDRVSSRLPAARLLGVVVTSCSARIAFKAPENAIARVGVYLDKGAMFAPMSRPIRELKSSYDRTSGNYFVEVPGLEGFRDYSYLVRQVEGGGENFELRGAFRTNGEPCVEPVGQ